MAKKTFALVFQPILGKNGLEKIVEYKLEGDEKAKFDESVAAARNTNSKLGDALKA